ncbi:lipid II:glycine glycyltransferase FemX [Patescibacteria group bacterium]
MNITEITDKNKWNELVASQKNAQFLQSWEWGEFHKKMGRKVWRVVVDGVVAQIIKYSLPFGQNYLYCPRGPGVNPKSKVHPSDEHGARSPKSWNIFLKKIKELAKEEKSMFVRVELSAESDENDLRIGRRVKSVQPENDWVLDLKKNKEELLAGMHHKTRYNIMLAKKKGVKIRLANNNNDFEKFWELISNTYNRKNINTHTKEYYNGILGGNTNEHESKNESTRIGEGGASVFCVDGDVKLWVAEYEGKIIASNMVSYFGDTATYMHGGSDYENRNLMATYLLQWQIIQDAIEKQYKYYNFGGVETQKGEWQGITRFKKGFGGFEAHYAGTYDVILRKIWYNMYKVVKGLKF